MVVVEEKKIEGKSEKSQGKKKKLRAKDKGDLGEGFTGLGAEGKGVEGGWRKIYENKKKMNTDQMEKELSCEQKVKKNESRGKGSLEQEKNNEIKRS
jgi:hypothetical protein